MDPELKRLVEETHMLARENNRMLRAIRRSQWYSFMSTVIIWVVVLALPLYLYQKYLQPVIADFSTLSGMPSTTTSGFLGLPTFADVEKLINSVKSGQ